MKLPANSQLLVIMNEIVRRVMIDAEKQSDQGSQRRAFSRLVGPENDVHSLAAPGKIENDIGKRAEGEQL
jgi:hypothetical protein